MALNNNHIPKFIQPWKIEMCHLNVAHCIDLEALRDEIAALSIMTEQEDGGQRFVNNDLCPNIIHLRDDLITPAVVNYAHTCWGYEIEEMRGETNAKWIKEGEGLFPHFHPGSQMSAIFYPDDAPTGLNMFDPRGNACRGYPKPIRNNHMGMVQISPKAGDIWIFPSYLQHSVSHVKEDTRLSLLTEYYFSDER
ncbi:hypothetical protein D3C85_233940 [compost metagenome]